MNETIQIIIWLIVVFLVGLEIGFASGKRHLAELMEKILDIKEKTKRSL